MSTDGFDQHPREFKLLFPSGDPDSVRVASMDDLHTFKVLLGYREEFNQLLTHSELKTSGACVYLLKGREGRSPKVYIGSTGDPSNRIKNNYDRKKWWTEIAVIFFSQLTNETEAKFLEALMIKELRNVNQTKRKIDQVQIENKNNPRPPKNLTPLAEKRMSEVLRGVKEVFPLIQIDVFKYSTPHILPIYSASDSNEQTEVFHMKVPGEGKHAERRSATAIYSKANGELTVLKGSHARNSWASKKSNTSEERHRERLLADGSLRIDRDGTCQFTKDVVFTSPSAAAGVVAGRSVNGRMLWKARGTNQTFDAWERTQGKKN